MFEQKKLETIILNLEHLLRKNSFKEVDSFLESYDVENSSSRVLLGVLTITFRGKDNLLCRDNFLVKAEKRIREELGNERAEYLLVRRR